MRPARLLRAAGAATTLAAAACHWGTRPDDFPPARSPAGARVAVRVSGERADRVGELYAVDTAGVTILPGARLMPGARLVRIAWPRVRAMDVARLGGEYDVPPGETVGAAKRQQLALVSRFPQGLGGELLSRVLARLRQDTLDVVR